MHIIWTILIGFIVGLLAKMLAPGRDPSGFFLAVAIGIAGSLLATCGRCSTSLSRYRWTLRSGTARRRLLHHLNRLPMPATFAARRLRTCAASFIEPTV